MRLITNLFKTLLILVLLAGVGVLGMLLLWQQDLRRVDDLNVLEYGGKATVVDAGGRVIGALTPSLSSGARVNRDLLRADQFSPWLGKAVVTSEDRRFYEHHGVDPMGIARALLRSASGSLEGGSTITQQVVRSTLLEDIKDERTPARKLKEALLALQVERRFTKQEILTAYLNVVYWGVGRTDLLGAQDAARAYFGIAPSQLNLAQSVYLTTLLPNARRYNNYVAYRPLMRSILNRMVEDGRATKAQADAAWRYPLQPVGWRVRYDGKGNIVSARLVNPDAKRLSAPAPQVRFADGFLDAVERDLADRLGRKVLYQSDVTVYTTMNRAAQQAAEAASKSASLPNGATLGLALLDPKNGDVQALVGQKLGDGVLEEWNNATRARRQVGSSIKPLLYTLALAKGWTQADTLRDAPLDGDYQPQNYSGTYTGGPVTLRYALDHSLNLPTVRLAQQLGLNSFESRLRELGLSPNPDTGLPLAIGALEASPLQMAAAYAPFANGGLYYAPRLITRVVQGGHTLLTVPASSGKRVWDAQTAWLGLDMIRGVVNDLTPRQGGLGWRARIEGREVGGKTGTTNDVRDLWFAGVTPELAGAVWVGRSDNAPLPQNSYSGDVAAPVWQQAVAGALQGQPAAQFQPPDQIEYRRVRGIQMAFKAGQDQGGIGSFFRRDPQPQATPPAQEQAAPEPQPQDTTTSDSPQPDVNEIPALPPTDPAPEDTTSADPATPPADPAPTDPTPTEPVPADSGATDPVPAADPTPDPAQDPTLTPIPDGTDSGGLTDPSDIQPLPDSGTDDPNTTQDPSGGATLDTTDPGTVAPDGTFTPPGQ
ncbi:transglycosylase domain-containing protein [Deinococcus sonorensis]|uniref:peptidoglycan glycosyltransferase n=2 Tax=Deinococcus sonorensis TaxID=309891 RepID=A0AAU7UC85_9DEIO